MSDISSATAPIRPVESEATVNRPRWQVLYDAMSALTPGTLLRYEEMGELLRLDFLERRDKQIILASARKAANELQGRERKVFRIVRGHGYQVAVPDQILALAHRHQARAVAEVEAGHAKIETIDLGSVDTTTARLIEATAMGFARQAGMMRQLDVRQKRLETAMAAINATAQSAIERAEQTSTQVEASQAELQRLQRRVAELEARQPPHSTSSLPPSSRR